MLQYEVNFIVDPVLSGDEIKSTAKTYEDMIKDLGATIVNVDDNGLRQLAYPIKKRTSGIYYVVEFQVPNGTLIAKTELALKRDERILRFLTVKLDKYAVQYNADKRAGKIKTYKKKEKESKDNKKDSRDNRDNRGKKSDAPRKTLNAPKKEAPVKAAPAPAPAKSEEE